MKTWIITDTHFGHLNIQRLCFRPEDSEAQMIATWRNRVEISDVIIHLGDVYFGKPIGLAPIIQSLPGTKILIRGNHDKFSWKTYYEAGFDACMDAMILSGVYFTHKPALSLPDGCEMNVCGHIHNNTINTIAAHEQTRFQAWHRPLAIELMQYAPQTLESVRRGKWHRRDVLEGTS